jgi:hypothetical protein
MDDVMGPVASGCSAGYSMAGNKTVPGLNEFSGSYAPTECQAGMLGSAEYYRAYRESEIARAAPDVLARSVRSTWDEPFLSIITPEKPAAVSLAGYDVFGAQNFSTTTRNMTLDLRGEAAYAPNLTGEIPVGASVSSLAMGAAVDYADCDKGCGCRNGSQQSAIRMPGPLSSSRLNAMSAPSAEASEKCSDMCRMNEPAGRKRAVCMRGCQQDQPQDPLARAGTGDDQYQSCVLDCATGSDGNPGAQRACEMSCERNLKATHGGKVFSVHPSSFFTPRQIQPVSVLRPYHV